MLCTIYMLKEFLQCEHISVSNTIQIKTEYYQHPQTHYLCCPDPSSFPVPYPKVTTTLTSFTRD